MKFSRVFALIAKERRQLFRDPFNIVVGIGLPLVLLVIMGYGLSFDVKNIRVAVVVPANSALASEVVARLRGSAYFSPLAVRDARTGTELVRAREADACLFLPQCPERGSAGGNADFLIATNATNPQQARMKESYLRSILAGTLAEESSGKGAGTVQIVPRMWFNESGESVYFLVPGLIAIILTLVGTLLTSMLMAQEYERGNLESMFVTPMKSAEMLLAKVANNFVVGAVGIAVVFCAARLFFGMPVAGSVPVLCAGCALYLLMSLSVGLLISSLVKNQFVASQLAIVVTLLPSILLSGYIYEIGDLPPAIRAITLFVPARYFIDFLQTILLAGNFWEPIARDLGVVALFALAFTLLAVAKNPKRLEP